MSSGVTQLPSPFVRDCLGRLGSLKGKLALDVPCGFGRHTILLARNHADVLAVDIDESRVSFVAALVASSDLPKDVHVSPLCADGSTLSHFVSPVDLAIVTDIAAEELLLDVLRLIVPGGHLIFETFQNRGQNWRSLPRAGSIGATLQIAGLVPDVLQERRVGPDTEERVTVKCFAVRPRRKWEARSILTRAQ